MTPRKTPILLRRGPLSGNVWEPHLYELADHGDGWGVYEHRGVKP